ncbi:efflux RND transporter periplasmic adaptor subunit [Roseateles saccharophilus]|uniref:Cu(I)/Ag(I) efflux system membrane fusion protein n=1 Tax=Roseateles saccharophilus TaxID=304 RepID=A0A4R3VEG0_ROSSA|nr:efflux RND transporter periplasmic adaptor subunit [Roseateles saccharophilus]MDG0833856.1 efflux RND transporter periplasmic adaptor subunit [Roseateles saccharophilus]TCV02323.1 Cu(I)/Ag(I) efflux system membrane fusion protein [Roseateles saccharophilus]
MKRATLVISLAAAGALLAAAGFLAGRASGHHEPAAAAAAPAERKPLYWQDPMVPGARFDKPGKSPFMDMQLVPVYADEAGDGGGVKISPTVQQNLGLRTAAVTRTEVSPAIAAVGTVQFDERLGVAVQTRVAGYVEKLSVRATMEQVRKGQALATVFAPEWLAPQNELLALKRAGAAPELIAAARERMRALSLPDGLVRQSEESGVAEARFTLNAPASGVVTDLGVREGMQVSPGMTLFRIAGLDKVWAVAEIPEAQAVRLARGQKVGASLQADAAQVFSGTLQEILPQVNASTRTLQARFEVDNRGGQLLPGMLLRLQIAGAPSTRLLVPAEAVIRTGTRAVAIARRSGAAFEPRELKLGLDLGDRLEVLDGLTEGDEVVVSGQFLIDSEARLKSVLGAMSPARPEAKP